MQWQPISLWLLRGSCGRVMIIQLNAERPASKLVSHIAFSCVANEMWSSVTSLIFRSLVHRPFLCVRHFSRSIIWDGLCNDTAKIHTHTIRRKTTRSGVVVLLLLFFYLCLYLVLFRPHNLVEGLWWKRHLSRMLFFLELCMYVQYCVDDDDKTTCDNVRLVYSSRPNPETSNITHAIM